MYFFRSIEDGNPLDLFSPTHIIMMAVFILISYFIIRGKAKLLQLDKSRMFSKILAVIMLIDQIVLYTWQLGSGFFNLGESLPLFHCRIAVWILISGVLFKKDNWLTVGMLWGIIGSISALVAPDLYHFKFPHYTNFNFFIVHLSMGWLIFHLLFNYKMMFTKKSVMQSLIVTNLFNLFVLVVSLILRPYYPTANYGYMLEMPASLPWKLSLPEHILIVTLFFNCIIGLIGFIFCKISDQQHREYESIQEIV